MVDQRSLKKPAFTIYPEGSKMSINFSDLSRGLVIELDGQPWEVMDYQRHKMQQRAPVTRIKMRNLLSGAVVERTFQQYSTGFTLADVDTRPTQYL